MQPCWFCQKDVNTDDVETYRQVTSWVNGPKLDGPKLRIQRPRFAHPKCIENVVAGQAADQPELFEEVRPRCEAQTHKGICDGILSPHGDCMKEIYHV